MNIAGYDAWKLRTPEEEGRPEEEEHEEDPEPAVPMHRIHAVPTTGKGGRSFEVGGYRWRPDGGGPGAYDAKELAYRLAFTWNMAEGIPLHVLERGAIPAYYEAVDDLLLKIRETPELAAALGAEVMRVQQAYNDLEIDNTNGRRHDCAGCIAKEGSPEGGHHQMKTKPKAKHTPGPWTWVGDHTHRQFEIYMLIEPPLDVTAFSKHVCTVNNLPRHHIANRDPEVAVANARVIAAAPDGYEAARQFLADYDAVNVGAGERFRVTVDHIEAFRAFVARIETEDTNAKE